jgi:16S rRNA (cytosine1402-N4)-methyltransferase
MPRNPDYHEPVLASQSVQSLLENNDLSGVYVDATFGSGGHSERILEALNEDARLIAFDRDVDASENLLEDKRLILIEGNFSHLENYLDYLGIEEIDGCLADIGVSSFQFDNMDRGFSFQSGTSLDMRMSKHSKIKTAEEIINTYEAKELQRILTEYGEVRFAKSLAREIVLSRRRVPIKTGKDLVEVAKRASGGKVKMKELAQIFQAIRIEVNGELDALKNLLMACAERVREQGKVIVISYHSLEDRIVKRFFMNGNFSTEPNRNEFGQLKRPFRPMNKKPIVPTDEEIQSNVRARSAKMRIGIKESSI